MARRIRLGIVLAALAATLTLASAAAAATNYGNAAVARTYTDGFYAFSIVDTAATAPSDGVITDLNYYAANTNSFRFVLIDSVAGGNVLWVSPDVTPAGVGPATFTPAVQFPSMPGTRSGSTRTATA